MMTEEEIEEMEKQGYDMSSVWEKQTELAAQNEAKDANFAQRRKDTAVSTDLKRLSAYCSTPRDTECAFFADVAGKAPLFLGIARSLLTFCGMIKASFAFHWGYRLLAVQMHGVSPISLKGSQLCLGIDFQKMEWFRFCWNGNAKSKFQFSLN